jgi:ABC-type transporter Mla subunit MlaD
VAAVLSGYLSNVFLGIALVVVVFAILWYLEFSAESLRDGLGICYE